jgi:hypothetical protein
MNLLVSPIQLTDMYRNIRHASLPAELIPCEDILASVESGVRVGTKS